MPRTKKASFKVSATSSIALSLALILTGCAAGQNAASRTIKQVTDGVELSIQDHGVDIEVLNLLLVATETGDAVVVGTIVNQGDTEDQLLGIAVGSNQAVLTGEPT